jgi:hypothetical protein
VVTADGWSVLVPSLEAEEEVSPEEEEEESSSEEELAEVLSLSLDEDVLEVLDVLVFVAVCVESTGSFPAAICT